MGLIFLRFFKFICEKSCPRLDIGREELDKYLNGRIKAHDHYFTEISPAIPKEYADCFKVNGCLLPGYTIEGEEPAKAAALPTQEEAAQPQQTTATPERREPVNEVFSIFLDNRAEAQTGGPHGYWLSLPTSAEQVQETLKEIHITADNQQDLFIGDFSAPEGKPLELPEDLIKTASVDELNFLAAQLQKLDAVELAELNAVMQSPAKMQTIGQLLDYAENTDCFVLINAKDNRSLGEYRQLMSCDSLTEAVEQAILGGCTMIQLREKELSSLEFYNQAVAVKQVTDKYHIPLIINDRIDIAMAVQATGVHIGQHDLPAAAVRKVIGENMLLGVSALQALIIMNHCLLKSIWKY